MAYTRQGPATMGSGEQARCYRDADTGAALYALAAAGAALPATVADAAALRAATGVTAVAAGARGVPPFLFRAHAAASLAARA